jgi:hypothetical protein
MNRVLVTVIIALVLFVASHGSAAEPRTWTGIISDSHCGAKPHAGEHKGKKVTDKQCIIGIEGDSSYKPCLGYGAKFVVVSDGVVYKVANQDHAGLRQYAGDAVTVTGQLQGDTITVATITAAGRAAR